MEPGQQCSCYCRQWERAGSPLYPRSSGFQRDFGVGLQPLQKHCGASDCIFRVCWVPKGGGLKTGGSFSQEAESAVTFENCTASGASVASGSPLGNDVFGNPLGNDVGGK